jgi:UDP:flavonoid glycosyltransferase YjiC (YdhE family)
VFPIDAVGHVNPLLAITSALAARPDVAEVRGFGAPDLAAAFTSAGAGHVGIPNGPEPCLPPPAPSDLAVRSFLRPLPTIAEVLDACADFAPDVILYDVFSVRGFLAARALGIPAASLAVLPGYGALGDDFVLRHGRAHPALSQANSRYREVSTVDVLGEVGLPVLFPARELSIVTAVPAMARPVDPERMPRLHALLAGHLPACRFVGPCLGGAGYLPRPPGEPGSRRDPRFPYAVLDRARRDGATVVLFSLGTSLTDFRFDSPVGGAPTGREFLLALLDRLIEAFGGDPEILVVAAIGSRLAEADEPDWPTNFVVRDVVPQAELLGRYAAAFITHHGLSSTMEAIRAGVPMVSVPGVGDQLTNADLALEHGVAAALWDLNDPFRTCDASGLAKAVHTVLEQPAYRLACAELRAAGHGSGGAVTAAELVVGLAG